MSQYKKRPAPLGYQWIRVWEVRHWRSGKMIRRKDGLPFVFLVRKSK